MRKDLEDALNEAKRALPVQEVTVQPMDITGMYTFIAFSNPWGRRAEIKQSYIEVFQQQGLEATETYLSNTHPLNRLDLKYQAAREASKILQK